MRSHRGIVAALLFGYLAQACSSGGAPSSSSRTAEEDLGTAAQAITVACSEATLGLPCDPDGPAKPKTECEGACWFNLAGSIVCSAVKAGALDGISCGTQAGIGDGACQHYCSGKTCLAGNAPVGMACRPSAGTGLCEGQCNQFAQCVPVAQPCAVGRDEQLCKVAFCDQRNANKCDVFNMAKGTTCSDADVCAISACDATGVCVAGGTAGCDDGNSCTDDSCDPMSGACIGTIDNTNACSDGNACTVGDSCNAGACKAGTSKLSCDDGKLCTTDSCDPNTGCANVPIACGDNDACTTDSCDPNTGGCVHDKLDCDDQNPCTIDDCSVVTGCTHTPMNCDDGSACTTDSCTAGVCGHVSLTCDDSDACTDDTCVPATGCAHAPIVGCGVVGAGGAGGAPDTGGTGGTAVTAGTGGTGDTAGTAGTEAGGSTTDGGAGGAVDPGVAGQPSEAGSSTAGSSPSGGDAPIAGTSSSTNGGSETSTAGTESGGSTGANAGSSSTAGGTTTDPGAGGDGSTNSPTRVAQDSGCGCRVVESPRQTTGAWALALLGALAFVRRRKHA